MCVLVSESLYAWAWAVSESVCLSVLPLLVSLAMTVVLVLTFIVVGSASLHTGWKACYICWVLRTITKHGLSGCT